MILLDDIAFLSERMHEVDVSENQQQFNKAWLDFWEGRGEFGGLNRFRKLAGYMPAEPRCKGCNVPFKGIGGNLVRAIMKRRPSNKMPHYCNHCEEVARKYPGGAEVNLTMLFADVRGSTALAERMSASEFRALLNRFYGVANTILIRTEAWIDKLVGDEVIGFYIPGLIGPEHARLAIQAARELLEATGHSNPAGPWLPVGVGLHTGVAFLGVVGAAEGHIDITALGDNVNIAARLASKATQGEILISDATYTAASLSDRLEQRQLELKGKSQPFAVHVMQIQSA